MEPRVPQRLVNEILKGRCVAFVGAGFSTNVPTWGELLRTLAAGIGGAVEEQVKALVPEGVSKSAFDCEAAGQLIRDALSAGVFEQRVRDVVNAEVGSGSESELMAKRRRWLTEIPFAAILTTNYDGNFRGLAPTESYGEILRREDAWWKHDDFGRHDSSNRPEAVKLHGDANGSADDNPVVLGKSDYRRLIYEDGRYGNFLRAIFATRTVLFIGVSFTDAYLNELRSEVMSLLRACSRALRKPELGYAILPNRTGPIRKYFLEHEGIEVLHYEANGVDHSGCDELQAIHARTAPVRRLRELFENNNRIVWVDRNQSNNDYGVGRLQRDVGARVDRKTSAAQLDEDEHSEAQLLITHFGYDKATGHAAAYDVLSKVNRWERRPPVIVFASGDHAYQNRLEVIRRGAFELASRWSELFEQIERLFGRLADAPSEPIVVGTISGRGS